MIIEDIDLDQFVNRRRLTRMKQLTLINIHCYLCEVLATANWSLGRGHLKSELKSPQLHLTYAGILTNKIFRKVFYFDNFLTSTLIF